MDITTTAHPGTLTTAEDYANAPVGTIVAEDGSDLPKVEARGERLGNQVRQHGLR